MSERFDELCFIDTNIWLYAFIASQDKRKHIIAKKIINEVEIVVSVQVINEVAVNLIKKASVSELDIQRLVRSFYSRYPVWSLDENSLILASELRQTYQLSFWDSQIIANALESGASFLITEDMQNGMEIRGSLKIVNPFIDLVS